MAALLAHELAHSLVARRYGVPVTSITLWALGGVSELGSEPPTARADLRIAAAGPATSLAAGPIIGGLPRRSAPGAARPSPSPRSAGWLAAMNVLLAAFNLLPGARLTAGGSCARSCGGATATGSAPRSRPPRRAAPSARGSSPSASVRF